jgi:hypothetical protein
LDKGILKLSEELKMVNEAMVCEIDGKILSEALEEFYH